MKKFNLLHIVTLLSLTSGLFGQTSDQLIRLHNIANEYDLNALTSPYTGSLAHVTSEKNLYVYDGQKWISPWTNLGNSNIDATSTGFLGTTNNTDLRFNTNGVQRMVVKADGKVGIGLNNPIGRFQVNTASSNIYINVAVNGTASCNNGFTPHLAIDDDPTTTHWNNGWNVHFWSFDWLMIDLTALNLNLPVVRYTLRSPSLWGEPFHANITIWEFQGSLDGVNWVDLHAINSFIGTNTYSWDWGTVTYNIDNNVAYNRYRIMVHAGSTGLMGTNPYFAISDFNLFVRDTTDLSDDFIVTEDGNVGIGTVPTQDLHVNGNILASGSITPDYVFEHYFEGNNTSKPNYRLRSVEEVKEFVKENKHLPGVPSAQDIENQGGIIINRATEINLEKIEELYLYMFEVKKKNKALKKRLNELEKTLLKNNPNEDNAIH